MPKKAINYDARSKRITNSIRRTLFSEDMNKLTNQAYHFVHTYMNISAHRIHNQFMEYYTKTGITNFAMTLASQYTNQYGCQFLAAKYIQRGDEKSEYIGHTIIDIFNIAREYLSENRLHF